MKAEPGVWLVKSEPTDYSIDDLERDRSTLWTGIRNYQSRNFIRDGMRKGDLVLYYHSGGKAPGMVGVARVKADPIPDPTQFDPDSAYHDPRSAHEAPRWWCTEIEFVERWPRTVTLREVKRDPRLGEMSLLRRPRLSVHPVRDEELTVVRSLAATE